MVYFHYCQCIHDSTHIHHYILLGECFFISNGGIKITIGERLKKLREEHQYSQKELANILLIDQGNYSRMENDEYAPPLDLIKTLCELYQVSADYVLDINVEHIFKQRQNELIDSVLKIMQEEKNKI